MTTIAMTTQTNRQKKTEMFWTKIFATKQDLVLAVCDEELIEKELKMKINTKTNTKTSVNEKKNVLKVKVSKNFYGGMLVNEAVVARLMNKATIGNMMGARSVALAEKNGFILRENIILIDEVPHAQFVKISEIR
jgi:hypothetical protein